MNLPQDQGTLTLKNGWAADKHYSITYSSITRMINGLYGAITPFEDVVHSNEHYVSHYLGCISEKMYNDIGEAVVDPSRICFWTEANELKVRMMVVDFGPNTFLDSSRNAIVGLNNYITLLPKVVDQDGKIWSDITEISIKNMEKKNFEIKINNQDARDYKGSTINGVAVNFELLETGRCTVRFKALVPEVDHLWLSLYPELYSYKPDDLAKFAEWVATNIK